MSVRDVEFAGCQVLMYTVNSYQYFSMFFHFLICFFFSFFNLCFFHISMAVQCMIFGLFSGAILYEQLQSVMRDETAIEYLIRMKRNRLRRKRTTSTGIGFRKNTTVLPALVEKRRRRRRGRM